CRSLHDRTRRTLRTGSSAAVTDRPADSVHRPSTLGLVFADAELERELRSGLTAVEVALREAVKSSYPFVTETSLHLVDAGGKRFRPLLVLLAAQFGDAAA